MDILPYICGALLPQVAALAVMKRHRCVRQLFSCPNPTPAQLSGTKVGKSRETMCKSGVILSYFKE